MCCCKLHSKHALRAAQLDMEEVVHCYQHCKRRLLVLGYNATLTTAVEAPRVPKRTFDQMQVCHPPANLMNTCRDQLTHAYTELV